MEPVRKFSFDNYFIATTKNYNSGMTGKSYHVNINNLISFIREEKRKEAFAKQNEITFLKDVINLIKPV